MNPIRARKRAVIFGTGKFAEVAHYYLTHDAGYEIAAFAATGAAATGDLLFGAPVVEFEDLARRFPPDGHEIYVAVGARKFNALRAGFLADAKARGYRPITYVCSKAIVWPDLRVGEHAFVFEANVIQPFAEIGANAVLWSGNHIGHHSRIGEHCFVTSHVVVSGMCEIGESSFVGVNATLSESVRVGPRNLIGPNALIQKDTGPDEAHLAPRTEKFPKPSGIFLK